MRDRAQSVGLARFILAYIGGAPVLWILLLVSGKILPGAREATNSSQANQATTWIDQGIQFFPIWYLLVGFFGLIVLSIFQRELLR
jgi:hypothetical protein